MKKILISLLVLSAASLAVAKLPPLNDEAKAKAAEAAATRKMYHTPPRTKVSRARATP